MHWGSCHVVLDGEIKWLFGSNVSVAGSCRDSTNATHVAQHLHDQQSCAEICVILSGIASGSASLFVLRTSGVISADEGVSFEMSRSRSSSDAPLPSSSSSPSQVSSALSQSFISLVAQLPAASDKEITRVSCSTKTDSNQTLIVASSQDGTIRAFKIMTASQLMREDLPYKLVAVWRIAAVKSEIKEWFTQPMPFMSSAAAKSVLEDDIDGNDVDQQTWLLPQESSAPFSAAASKSSSAIGGKLRAAIRQVAAVATMAQSRDMWLLGGTSTSSASTRWYNLHLAPIDVKRIVEASVDALGQAVAACDILPMLDDDRSHSNPRGLEVLVCTVANVYGDTVLAGYNDGTFRVWKKISSNAPPAAVMQSVASIVYSETVKLSQNGVKFSFYCFRTFKLSENSIADVMMTLEQRCAVVLDAVGMQFVVSVCPGNNPQRNNVGYNWFNNFQMPFSFTVEPTAQARHFITFISCSFLFYR